MRLSSIRLAGFKSFVDPTTIVLDSNLSAVVGPNGCGKSNVIDAVRWVTGESSARQLRGEALEDVIFNGSRARKPVGRASVELKFDNSEGTLGGEYGAFSEISIKRELARDGGSRYFINGAKSRRRDVIDLFLGTGLGGRSNYAVIEQGAVNRLIEARPEEMRQVLEEAAGISKYKERRRETENRIRHTRENLERLNDLIGEVTQRLGVLKRQAANAEKYKTLKADERRLRAELLALRWAAQSEQVEAAEARQRECEDALRRAISGQREARETREALAADQQAAMTAVQQAQAAFYDAQSEAARIEQRRAHAREMRELRERERAELVERLETLDAREAEDHRQAEDLAAERDAAERARAQAEAERSEARRALDAAEQAAVDAERVWDEHNASDDNPAQRLEAERTRARYARERCDELIQRRDARTGEREGLGGEDDEALAAAEQDLETRSAAIEADRRAARGHAEEVEALEQRVAESEQTVERLRTELGESRARLASERQLQQSVLREDDAGVRDWLAAHERAEAPGIARRIKVREGWQTAVESALGPWLQGFAVARLPAVEGEWPAEPLTLVETDADPAPADASGPPAAGPAGLACLADGLDAPAAIRSLARQIYVVDDIGQALARRDELAADQWLVTLDGARVGRGTLVTPAGEAAERGVLEREARIETLTATVAQAEADLEARVAALDEQRQALKTARDSRRALDQSIAAAESELESRRARHQGERERARQRRERRAEIDTELADLNEQIETAKDEAAAREAGLERLAEAAEDFQTRRRQAQAELGEARAARETARKRHGEAEQRLRDVEAQQTALAGRVESLDARRRDTAAARADVAERLAAFDAEAAPDGDEADDSDAHERAVAAREAAERELRGARERLAECEKRLETQSETAMQADQGMESAREALQQAQIAVETAGVRRAGVVEQLEELGESPASLVEQLPADATADAWSSEIEAVERRIQRLGAINLAAIEEYDAEAEREAYLGEQHADLSEALETLEQAIAKIDRETRQRFRATYEQVNGRFAAMFPDLFGGGEAALELTEDDWLVTGIRVMARPPGKRNASIQMLSGGEKALTAVALLFALFELNPAPFCMLDEIDAPLDDANVSRFCELVRRMSTQVQFIVITHNKLTMSLAEQLHGVTMAEPGVSRLVSVDIDQALDMAG